MAYEDLILATGEVITTQWYSDLVTALNEIIAGAISKLSELEIDADKDWAGKVIKNLGAPVVAGDAYSKGNLIDVADIPNLPASIITSGRFGVGFLEWTSGKLLIGAGPGSNPTEIDPPVSSMDFWSSPQEEVSITSTAGDKTLPSVTVAGIPGGATIIRVICMLKMRAIENTHATILNKLNGNQYVQVKESAAGNYTNAILLVDDLWTIAPATREGGDIVLGSLDVKTEVDGNDTYAFKIANAWADQNNLNLNDVQCGIRVMF